MYNIIIKLKTHKGNYWRNPAPYAIQDFKHII